MKSLVYSAKDIAQWFINRAQFDGEKIEKIKLQKLLYFSQGVHLTLNKAPLFEEDFTNFKNGPVIKKIYPLYSEIEGNKINAAESVEIDIKTTEFLERIYKVFGQYATWKLVEMSHEQTCYENSLRDFVIYKEEIKKHFENDNKEHLAKFKKMNIDRDMLERIYLTNKYFKTFKALSK